MEGSKYRIDRSQPEPGVLWAASFAIQVKPTQSRGVKTGSVFMGDGFEAEGSVWLLGAKIDGNLECDKGRFLTSHEENRTGENCAINGDEFDVALLAAFT
jgi:hypothetical protein